MAKVTNKGRTLFETIAKCAPAGSLANARHALEACSLLSRYAATLDLCNLVECNGAAVWQDDAWQRRTAASAGWPAVDAARNRAINCAELTSKRFRKLASGAVIALHDAWPYIVGADYNSDCRGPAIRLQTADGREIAAPRR